MCTKNIRIEIVLLPCNENYPTNACLSMQFLFNDLYNAKIFSNFK